MHYFEVFVADNRYHSDRPLTYSYQSELRPLSVVSVPLQNRVVSGFVMKAVPEPSFNTKAIKALNSSQTLPQYCLDLAKWLQSYYLCNFSEAMRQFAPTKPVIRRAAEPAEQSITASAAVQIEFDLPLTKDQKQALSFINKSSSTTILLHGDTGSGKTRVYLELARQTLDAGKSVILLTPEIALTTQLAAAVEQLLPHPTFVLHSELSPARRKQLWFGVLEASEPIIVIGPRSALFAPIKTPGLIIVDEEHEPAYKQEQSPRYHVPRVASQLGNLTKSKVILGSATPSVADYYLADQHHSIVRMKNLAIKHTHGDTTAELVDIRDRRNFTKNPFLSNQLIEAINTTLSAKKQVMLYLNRRGSARLVLCNSCGWQLLCPNCDIPLVYHADEHLARCHICGHNQPPPMACPECKNPDVIYKSIGTKALIEAAAKLFPQYRLQRFDSDNAASEKINQVYNQLKKGEIDILVGTQLLAKGFDLPKLGLVGIVAAESSLALPDYTSEERAYQLLYQAMGRVGRGHGKGHVVLQSYEPGNTVIASAFARDWQKFYDYALQQRQAWRWPPFSYLLRLTCRRTTSASAQKAAEELKRQLAGVKLPVDIAGPAPSFYARRGRYYYWQLVIKSKQREHLLVLAKKVPANWIVDLDPMDLL